MQPDMVVEQRTVTRGFPPFFAYLEHPDGRWYAVWMTRTEPRSQRGHPWHVHADYSSEDRMRFGLAHDWYQATYGMRNWDFDTVEEAATSFWTERVQPRLQHGYQIRAAHLADGWEG